MRRIVPLLLVLTTASAACTTVRQSKIGMGVGPGVAAAGGLLVASEGDDELGAVLVGAGLAGLGGAIALCSLIGYVATSLRDDDGTAPRTTQRASTSPRVTDVSEPAGGTRLDARVDFTRLDMRAGRRAANVAPNVDPTVAPNVDPTVAPNVEATGAD